MYWKTIVRVCVKNIRVIYDIFIGHTLVYMIDNVNIITFSAM